MSQREAVRHFEVSRGSVRKMMAFSVPPGSRSKAPVKYPKHAPEAGWVHRDHRILARRGSPYPTQAARHCRACIGVTAGRARLRRRLDDLKDYVLESDQRGRVRFVPLAHAPGHAQADFGEAMVVICGAEGRHISSPSPLRIMTLFFSESIRRQCQSRGSPLGGSPRDRLPGRGTTHQGFPEPPRSVSSPALAVTMSQKSSATTSIQMSRWN
jgi:hypothetical protein